MIAKATWCKEPTFRTELRGFKTLEGWMQWDAESVFRCPAVIVDYAWEDNVLQPRMRIGSI